MRRFSLAMVLAFLFLAGPVQAQQAQRGTIKKVDLEKGVVTITSEGKDYEAALTPQTMLRDAGNEELSGFREKGLPAGTAVMFRTEQRGDKLYASLEHLVAVVEPYTEPESARGELPPATGACCASRSTATR